MTFNTIMITKVEITREMVLNLVINGWPSIQKNMKTLEETEKKF